MRLRGKGRNRTATLQERAAFKYCTDVSMTVSSFVTEYIKETSLVNCRAM